MHESSPTGKILLWMSINGSRVMEFTLAHSQSGEVLAGSFANAQAIADYCKVKHLPMTIIMAGDQGVEVIEDRICADVIKHYIDDAPFEWEPLKREIITAFKTHYEPEVLVDIPYLVDHLSEFAIIPRCIVNSEGFIEVKAVV